MYNQIIKDTTHSKTFQYILVRKGECNYSGKTHVKRSDGVNEGAPPLLLDQPIG